MVNGDKDLLNETTIVVSGGTIEVSDSICSPNMVMVEYRHYYDEKEPLLFNMTEHQCELFIKLMQDKLAQLKGNN